MKDIKRIVVIIVALLLVVVGVFGSLYVLKIYFKKTPTPSSQIQDTVTIPGFKRDLENKIPSTFPPEIITEKDSVPISSFSMENDTETQYTYQYLTKKNVSENFTYFTNYLRNNNWEMESKVENASSQASVFWLVKGYNVIKNEYIMISFSQNLANKSAVIDITHIIKNEKN